MDRQFAGRLLLNGVVVDLDAERVRDRAGRDVPLRAQSFAVLRHLAANPERVVSKDELIGTVWRGVAVTDDSLVQCIGDVRRALGDERQRLLRTVPRRGYQLVLPPPGEAAPPRRAGAVVVVLLAALAAFAAAWWWRQPAPAPGGPPAIAVLPFEDMSAGGGASYLGDGVADDLISMLARSPDVLVMSRGASFAYGGAPADPREIGRALGVDVVLEGSVRREGDRLRVVAELIDTETRAHLWAERFDEAGVDPWALQDAIAARIVNSLAGETGALKQAQYREAWGNDSTSLAEYDYVLRGLDVYMTGEDKASYDRAAQIWREGLARHPGSALLKVKLGWYHWTLAWDWLSDDLASDFRAADRLVTEALAVDDLSPETRRVAHWLNALVLMQRGDFQRAVAEAEVAVRMAPYDARVLRSLTDVLAAAGEYDTALDWLATAEAREPDNPQTYHRFRGYLYRLMGRYADSAREYEALSEPWPYVRLSLAISYVRLGRVEDAREQVAIVVRDAPDWTQALWREGSFYSDPAILDAEIADLATAGLPER